MGLVRVARSTARLKDGRSVELRSAEVEEAAQLLAYVCQLSHESFRNLNHPPSYFEAMSVADEAAFIESTNAYPANFSVVGIVDGRIVGHTGLVRDQATLSSHCGELGIGVLEAYRGLGLGRLLMDRLLETATLNGITNLRLRVRTFNQTAILLYESLGFRRVGTLFDTARLPEGFADEYLYQRVVPDSVSIRIL